MTPNSFDRLPPHIVPINPIVVRKTASCTMKTTLNFIEALVKHFIRHPDPLVVPVFRFEYLGMKHSMYRYCYDMEYLLPISQRTKAIINYVAEENDRGNDNPFPQLIVEPEDLDVVRFLKQVVKQDRFFDLHGANVMQDHEGNYRTVDLEGFIRGNINDPWNDWITR